MSSSHGIRPRVLRADQWPEPDRLSWQAGLEPGDILDGGAYAQGLRPTTIRNSARGYGRWLAFLAEVEPAVLTLAAPERVTPVRIRAFLGALQAAGNTNNTIKARLWELRSALQIMHPMKRFRWLNYPAGQSLHALLPTTLQPVPIRDIRVLAQWGREMMAEALEAAPSIRRAVLYRNGLLVTILANRAPRISSLTTLRQGGSIDRVDTGYRMAFGADVTKGKRRLGYDLHRSLTPHIDHYLAVERPYLLGPRSHDWFWVNANGDQLGLRGIEGVLRRGSLARFGYIVSTHRFRHALATASMIANPTTSGVIAAVLGNSPAVVEGHYALGGQLEAAVSFQRALELDRAGTKVLAAWRSAR